MEQSRQRNCHNGICFNQQRDTINDELGKGPATIGMGMELAVYCRVCDVQSVLASSSALYGDGAAALFNEAVPGGFSADICCGEIPLRPLRQTVTAAEEGDRAKGPNTRDF